MSTAVSTKKAPTRKPAAKKAVVKKPQSNPSKKSASSSSSWVFWVGIIAIAIFCIKGCGNTSEPNDQVKTKITKFEEGGFGLVMIADFSITNNTQNRIKDIKIVCNGYSESKTKIDSNTRTIYKTINPGQTITINNYNMGYIHPEVQSTRCKTVEFNNA